MNKENFIEDLRFRVLSENVKVSTVKNMPEVVTPVVKNLNSNSKELAFLYEGAKSDVSSWNLEIRKFTKSDEGCYQCQLNSYKDKAIHYCLKLQSMQFFGQKIVFSEISVYFRIL